MDRSDLREFTELEVVNQKLFFYLTGKTSSAGWRMEELQASFRNLTTLFICFAG